MQQNWSALSTHKARDRDVNYEWREEKKCTKKNVSRVPKTRVPHMHVDLYLISEIFRASLFLSFPLRPRMLRSFENDREKCVIRIQLHFIAFLVKLRKYFIWVFLAVEMRGKKIRLIVSKAQFENDEAEKKTPRRNFFSESLPVFELQVRICRLDAVCLFQFQGY